MVEFNFSHYIRAFLENDSASSHLFFKDQHHNFTYKELISSSLGLALELENIPDELIALKMESSYSLFTHLLAGIIAKKKFLILSPKEPQASIDNYKSMFKFSKIITSENVPAQNNLFLESLRAQISLDQTAFCILSSGSTAPSKLISLSLKNVVASSKSFIDNFTMTSEEVLFLNLPHHHIGGLMVLWRAFFAGASVSTKLEESFHYISLVPLQLRRWMDDENKLEKLKQCKAILIGGQALDENLLKQAKDAGLRIYETYGMSETCSFVMLNGKPLPQQSVKLNSQGHLLIKGPTLSPDLPLDKEGFYITQDLGEQLPSGEFKFKGRSDLQFKSAGELIDPLYVETVIKRIPWIKEAVIVPIVHPTWSRASALIYSTTDSQKNVQDINDILRLDLHPHLIPRYFFEATAELFSEGMKPKRFDLSQWAQDQYYKKKFQLQHLVKQNSKKLMVVLHGFMEEHSDLLGIVDESFDCSYLFLDLPGHGKTEIDEFKSRLSCFDEMEELIRFYKKNNELLMYGYSMGGRIAMELAANLRPKILFLESAHFGLSTNEEKEQRLIQDMQLLSDPHLDLKNFFLKWYSNPLFGNYKDSKNYSQDVEKKLSHSPIKWHEALKLFSPGAGPYTLQENISKLMNIRIIGIVGSNDKKYLEHYQEVLKNKLNFKFFIIEDAAHNPHKTHLQEIKNILARLI